MSQSRKNLLSLPCLSSPLAPCFKFLFLSSAHLNCLVECNVFEKKNASAVPGGPRSRGPFRKKGLIKPLCRQDCLPWVFPICCLMAACSVLCRPVIYLTPSQSRVEKELYSVFPKDRCFSSDGYPGLSHSVGVPWPLDFPNGRWPSKGWCFYVFSFSRCGLKWTKSVFCCKRFIHNYPKPGVVSICISYFLLWSNTQRSNLRGARGKLYFGSECEGVHCILTAKAQWGSGLQQLLSREARCQRVWGRSKTAYSLQMYLPVTHFIWLSPSLQRWSASVQTHEHVGHLSGPNQMIYLTNYWQIQN